MDPAAQGGSDDVPSGDSHARGRRRSRRVERTCEIPLGMDMGSGPSVERFARSIPYAVLNLGPGFIGCQSGYAIDSERWRCCTRPWGSSRSRMHFRSLSLRGSRKYVRSLRVQGLIRLCHGPRAEADPRGLAVGQLRRGIRTTVVNRHDARHGAAAVTRAVDAFAAPPLSADTPPPAKMSGSFRS